MVVGNLESEVLNVCCLKATIECITATVCFFALNVHFNLLNKISTN